MSLAKAMATVAGLTGLSRIAGFTRDILTAAFLGVGAIADAFFVALKLPNFFRRVTAEGAFSVAFVPLYTKKLNTDDQTDAGRFAGHAFMVMLITLSVISLFAITYMPFIISAIAPGFVDDPDRFDNAVFLSQITFPYLLLISLSALLGGMMNAHGKFAPFAAAPILFNLCIIFGILGGWLFEHNIGYAMAWGVFISGILQFMWLFACLRQYQIKLFLGQPSITPDIKKLLKLMGPGVIGAGVMHLNLFADMIIASLLSTGAISYLYYADRLNQLPLGMVGIAIGTALLPMLSKALGSDDQKQANNLFNRSLEYCLILALPAAIALLVIPDIIIGALFERGAFTQKDTDVTSLVLRGYAIGLPAYIIAKVFQSVYWSKENTASPVKISIIITVLNIMLSLILIWPLGVAGIAFSTGIVGWLQIYLLHRGLSDAPETEFDDRFISAFRTIVFGSIVMGFTLLLMDDLVFERFMFSHIISLSCAMIVSAGIYLSFILGTGLVKMSDIKTYFKRS